MLNGDIDKIILQTLVEEFPDRNVDEVMEALLQAPDSYKPGKVPVHIDDLPAADRLENKIAHCRAILKEKM